MSRRTYAPGTKAPASAQYELLGRWGGKTGEERTVPKGHALPPPSKAGQRYQIADRTKNGSGRGS